jgi:nitrite reductase (NADH) large subunit
MSAKERLVLVGNGMAGMRTLEELLSIAPDRYDITVFGAEPYGNYNRILLSPVLAGEKTVEQIMINDLNWYAERGITLHAGKEVTRINRARRQVHASTGSAGDETIAPYDRLLLATGSDPFIIPIPGNSLPGVITFRDIRDVQAMLDAAQTGKKQAVVIGGGLLGLEAANGLMKQGMEVTVVHLLDVLMERQLDPEAAALLRASLEERGMRFLTGAQTVALLGEERVRGLRFKDGLEIPADLVVMAVGIRPNIGLAKAFGIHCERGIVVSDTMQTYDPRIYAVGECVQHRGQTYGLVAPLWEQARVCANHLACYGISRYRGSVTSTKLKVTGIDVFSAGDFGGGPGCDEIVLRDRARGVYKKLVVQDNRVKGAVMYGDTIDGNWYFQLLREGTDIGAFRDSILFGQAHLGDAGHGGNNVLAMADDAEICGCNGVCKGAIVKAITAQKLFTLEGVRAHTKASASCGSCTGLVEQLLAARRSTTICSPTWPGEYAGRLRKSRFINERVHANIQKDGTYSVVPRMWGGVTNAERVARHRRRGVDKFRSRPSRSPAASASTCSA